MAWWRRCKRPASSPDEFGAVTPLPQPPPARGGDFGALLPLPLREGAGGRGPEISLIVVCYNMARELPRTLRSLSPGYQRGSRPGQCEIIVVDNGSTVPPVAADFADLGLDLTIHRWPDPTPSPVPAVNHGLAQARGALVGVWIDGARMASPGLVAACAEAAALHPRPVIATPNYELGPVSQVKNAQQGYDAAEEDRLLASIGWPANAERLFEIAVPAWRSGIDGPMLESNALFMPRVMWQELGGYDPRFVSPGGGAANPDVFTRACELPGAQFIRIDGEATFHQIHGGTFSNAPGTLVELSVLASREYWRIRRRPLTSVRKAPWVHASSAGAPDRHGGLRASGTAQRASRARPSRPPSADMSEGSAGAPPRGEPDRRSHA